MEQLFPGKGRQLQMQQTLPIPVSTGHASTRGRADPEGCANSHHTRVTTFYLGVLFSLFHQEKSQAALGFP